MVQISALPAVVLANHAPVSGEDTSEAGGLLLGRRILGERDVVIDHVTTPYRLDESGERSFLRHAERHQRVIDVLHEESEGRCNYLGEWHTHDEDHPIASRLDIETMKGHLSRLEASPEDRFLILVLVGRVSATLVEVKSVSVHRCEPFT